MSILQNALNEEAIQLRKRKAELLSHNADAVLSTVTPGHVFGGMRGTPALPCETSSVSADEGLRIRGIPVLDLTNITPEETFWLLVTGRRATASEISELQGHFAKYYAIPQYVVNVLKAMPADSHPMAMFSTALLAMERESEFRAAYDAGTGKDDLWKYSLNDAVRLIASMPGIAAAIYRIRFNKGDVIAPLQNDNDMSNNFAHMLGISDAASWKELVRLYLVLHSDHEGGNVSAFTGYVVSSALSDPFYSVSAALCGLAGPLHGLANQECLRFIIGVKEKFGGVPSEDQIREFAWERLNSGQVIPGYGHAVLRVTDPRFTAFHEFAKKHNITDDNVQIVQRIFTVVPGVLQEHGKAKNPWPNVDAYSGSLLYSYGMTEFDFYTVMFGVSRAIGLCSQMITNRMMNLPIVRPKSLTLAEMSAAK
ncbi:MAG: citrate (Si)-synthase [Chlorobi bacterium]|nr:MAG: citrate (Si)-synthase [Bacteroidota bacterium]KXK34240.1 MAG: citrate synthase [Chlorobi bacterium OLB6]MBE2266277.1 citrate (Si)-synthase [Flavobacteriales bacterium]MBL1161043.1 citrate (Si)-synthase [Chlorobiota bacterium]MBW7854548.1 citrate (Si)-synthase [Candidatus Kapabacteria bacterium]MCC6330341.1 citrate (Si)-synthase [Ignavibacteria bacterium]